jgi:hypothetical protein
MKAFRKERNKCYGKQIEDAEIELGNINYENIFEHNGNRDVYKVNITQAYGK